MSSTTDQTPRPGPTEGLGTVLVTGGSSGLGAAVVEAVLKEGGRPVVLDRVAPPSGVEHEVVDLSDSAAAEAAVARVLARTGGLDAVVTAAGMDRPSPLGAQSREDWEHIVKVNLFGTAAVVRASLAALEASPRFGRLVTVASTLGFRAFGDATAYSASKFGVVGFTRSLMAETKGRIGVTLLTPAGMQTRFFDDRDDQYKPGPDARLNRPEDVARSVVFALTQPPGVEVRELLVSSSTETSWP